MKSNRCALQKGGEGLQSILSEVEKVTAYNGLPKKEALRLRLLAEELTGMLPELVQNFDGEFWMQNDGNAYELHVELSVAGMSKEKKDTLIRLSAKRKNASATGFMGRIREIAENMLLFSEDSDYAFDSYQYMYDYSMDLQYSYAWTLDHYVEKNKLREQKTEEWDELEKSIVASLADDVIVGVRGRNVDIIIKKAF